MFCRGTRSSLLPRRFLLLLIVLTLSSVDSRAATILYQQTPDQSDVFQPALHGLAVDSFILPALTGLSSTVVVNQVVWYGTPGGVNTSQPTFTIVFYEDDGGLPGAVFARQTVSTSISATGEFLTRGRLSNPEYAYSAFLSPLTFTAGATYWISIQPDSYWWWEYGAGGNGRFIPFRSEDPTDFHEHLSGDLAFTLLNGTTPEPSGLAFVATGLFGVFGIARRRLSR